MFKKTKLRQQLDKKNRAIAKQKPSYIRITYISKKDGLRHVKFEEPDRYLFISG